MNATPERCIAHSEAWPLDERKQMMRSFIAKIAGLGTLDKADPVRIANTYGPNGQILPSEVEAEMLKHRTESDGK